MRPLALAAFVGFLCTVPCGADAPQQEFVVAYSLLVGSRDQPIEEGSVSVVAPQELAHRFHLDPASDDEEVKRIFSLKHLGVAQEQRMQLPAAGGSVSNTFMYGGAAFEVNLRILPKDGDTAEVRTRILRDGELLSAPTVVHRLGEKLILSTEDGPEAPFLFLILFTDLADTPAPATARKPMRELPPGVREIDGMKVKSPKMVSRSAPVYPPEAKARRLSGVVSMSLILDREGKPTDIRVERGVDPLLDQAAVEAVKTWRFEPATHEGEPVPVLFYAQIDFRLPEDEKEGVAEPPR